MGVLVLSRSPRPGSTGVRDATPAQHDHMTRPRKWDDLGTAARSKSTPKPPVWDEIARVSEVLS